MFTVSVPGAGGGQKRAQDLPEQELLSLTTVAPWMLGTELKGSASAVSASNCQASSAVPLVFKCGVCGCGYLWRSRGIRYPELSCRQL